MNALIDSEQQGRFVIYRARFDTMNALTRDLRKAAADRGDAEWMSLWAGQGYPLARALPAAELVKVLAEEAKLTPNTA